MIQPTILRSAFSAGVWTIAGHGSGQALRLLGNLLLTRLLAPESFGAMAVATVISIGVIMFSDLGLRQVIVGSPRARDPDFINTVWTLQVLQGVLVAALLLLFALGLGYAQHVGFVRPGSTYGTGELPWLIAGLSLGAVINGLESTRTATAEKEMSLRPVVMIELGSQAAGLVAMCAVAAWHPTVYALLVGAVVSGAAKTAASHLLLRGTPNRLHFSMQVARQVCRISNWIVVSSALTFLSANFDKLFLAWLLGSDAMGQFAIAALLIGAVSDVVTRVASRVTFPALSKAFEADSKGLARSYHRSRIPTDAFCLFAAAFLFWFGDDLVRLLYDDRYLQAGGFLQILAITLVGSRYCAVSYVYLLLGRTKLMAAEQGFRLVGMLVSIAAGYSMLGTTGAIWGVAIGQLSGCIAGLVLFQPRLGLLSVRGELLALVLFAGALGVMGFASHRHHGLRLEDQVMDMRPAGLSIRADSTVPR
jgi:O-antigen/teichoic acid export membrane protein